MLGLATLMMTAITGAVVNGVVIQERQDAWGGWDGQCFMSYILWCDDPPSDCPAGSHTLQGRIIACRPCGAGTYNTGVGTAECRECGKGTYYTGLGATECTLCGTGTYSTGTGLTTCSQCSAGTYSNGTGLTMCRYCNNGTYSATAATACSNCAVGTYYTGSGASTYVHCTKGTFTTGTGMTWDGACRNFSTAQVSIAENSPFVQSRISLEDSMLAFSAALAPAGGFGVPCDASVPFLSVPGVLLSTVAGQSYPMGFGVAVFTYQDVFTYPYQDSWGQSSRSYAAMEIVQAKGAVPIQISLFPLRMATVPRQSTRRDGANYVRQSVTQCPSEIGWRLSLTKNGFAHLSACNCPANPKCASAGATTCNVAPASGDTWRVAPTPQTFCASDKNVSRGSDSESARLGIGLGIGLGGALMLCCLVFCINRRALNLGCPCWSMDSEIGLPGLNYSAQLTMLTETLPQPILTANIGPGSGGLITSSSDQKGPTTPRGGVESLLLATPTVLDPKHLAAQLLLFTLQIHS